MNSASLIGLDEPTEWEKFSHVVSDANHEWESHVVVEGMHCAACAINVEKALKSVKGVTNAEVNATSKRARITWSSDITKPSAWMEALDVAGYPALPANEIFNLDARRKSQRLMLWRLLVAGFCMMQVMMYAYPSYIASVGDMTMDIKNLLRWASWLLTLPVMFFSASPFLSNALHDIKKRQMSMDLPVALGIVITFLVSTAATFEPNGWWGSEVYFDSLTMFVFFLLTGRWLELRMRNRTSGALDVLMRRLPSSVERIQSDGSIERVAVSRLKLGDVVRVLPGEAFPADGVILSGETRADEALLTGESKPVPKMLGQQVIAGSYNLMAPVHMSVDQLGAETRYAQIVNLMERASVEKPRLALLADRIAQPFLWFVLVAAFGSAIVLWSGDHGRALMVAVSVLIVTCPCALSLATPAAMITISGALARRGVLVRRMQALEALTKIDTVVFDKTGTLSQEGMSIGQIRVKEGFDMNQALNIAAAMASHSLHPVSQALVIAYQKLHGETHAAPLTQVKELSGAGLIAESEFGALKLGSARFCDLAQPSGEASSVHLVSESGWIASFDIEEAAKADAVSSLHDLQAAGYEVVLLSGDSQPAVTSFAKKVGIQNMHGNCTPQDKLTFLQKLQHAGHQVLMVGDGLNDGPTLAMANVSVAMGQGVPLAQAQSDFVVLNNQVSMILILILQAKRTMRIIKQNLIWAFAYNIVCVPLAIAGLLPAWLAGLGMALSSLLVVGNALRLSSLPNEIAREV